MINEVARGMFQVDQCIDYFFGGRNKYSIIFENILQVIEVTTRTAVSLFETSSDSLRQSLIRFLGIRLQNNFTQLTFLFNL